MTIKSDLNLIFPIPVWTSLMPNSKELNQKLLKYIKSLQASDPKGKYKSNIKGWHSEDFDLKNEDVVFFINSISESLNKTFADMGWDLEKNKVKITSMLSIINKKDASNSRHIHSNNYISAAYYVKASENSGDIIFYDPVDERIIRNPKIKDPNKLNSNVFSIEPKEGLLVLFPSYLHHSVGINKSNEDRIVISFNVDLI